VTPVVRVVGVDPGPVPGVVVLSSSGDASVFQCDAGSVLWLVHRALLVPPVGPDIVADLVNGRLTSERVILAVERFVVGPRSARLSTPRAAAQTRDMVGAVVALGEQLAVTVVQRCAAEVMPWASDRRLAAAGLFELTAGMPHARAAARHALFAAVRDGNLPDPLSTKVRAP
jgi:hypothetical protein